MLSNNPAMSSPQLDLESRPPSRPVPARALQASSAQIAIPDTGYVSPRQHLGSRTSLPALPSQPSPNQQQQQQHHGLNAPRPSLSPLSEYHSGFGFSDEDLGSPSPSPSPYNLANHRRQHSFPNLLPLAFKSRTPSPTRKTHARSPSEQMPFTGDGRAAAGSPRGGGGGGGGALVSWLSGSSGAANALGLSPGANGTSKDGPTPDTIPTKHRRSATATDLTTPKSSTTAASRFMSALSSRFTPTNSTTPTNPSTAPDDETDELCTLDIESALFPHPSPSSPSSTRDPFSPAAFKNLHMNATGLLTRMQTAYRERATALREMQAQRDAQRDELEEAEMRATHLKMQLEDLARQAQEREGEMKRVRGELEAERLARARLERERAEVGERAASMVSEDLGVDEERRRRRRRMGGVSSGESDEEDENESAESESVFSRCRSPMPPPPRSHTTSVLSSPDGLSGMMMDGAGTPHARQSGGASVNATPKQKPGQQMNAFQKILKGISGEDSRTDGCTNCKGQDASVAWDTVGTLRDENRHLKTRVGELEVAVEGALDLVNGIGL